MFSRKNKDAETRLVPSDVLSTITDLVNESFSQSFESKDMSLDLYGEIYSDEIVLIFSLSTKNSENMISLFMSDDIHQDEDLKLKIDHLVESSSEFFEILTNSSSEEINELYSPEWKKSDIGKNDFFYKISRENIKLTIEANKILSGKV